MNPFDENPEAQDAEQTPEESITPQTEGASDESALETEMEEIPELTAMDPAFTDASAEEESAEVAEVVEELMTMEADEPSLVESAVSEAAQNDTAVDEALEDFTEPGESEVLAVGDVRAGAKESSEADGADAASDEVVEDEGGTEEAAPAGPDPNKIPGQDENPLMNWFIIHTYSGFENKVSESLRTRAEAFGFADRLGQILIPTEEVVEMRNGKKVTSKRLLYPGYVLVQMEMDDDLWHQVKNTPRVTQFVGGGGQPVPLSATEVNSILYRQTEAAERPRPKLSYEKNETVRIIDGPFANFQGKIDEINTERNTLRVMVTIFGRSTPVELDFLQVEKMA